MPLQKIRAGLISDAEIKQRSTELSAEGIRLCEGRTLLNRTAAAPSVLIVVEGELHIGVLDDDALLLKGEGVLLPQGAAYSLRAASESLAFLFSTNS